jgi:hypothetical protein
MALIQDIIVIDRGSPFSFHTSFNPFYWNAPVKMTKHQALSMLLMCQREKSS